MSGHTIIIAGGGAAGFFAAIAAAQTSRANSVTLMERSSQLLSKVRISGGGRCNVTNALAEPVPLSQNYPRGGRALVSPFHRFTSTDTVDWFERRGVPLKVEPDGRIFPRSDTSASIIGCLISEAEAFGVNLMTRRGLEHARRRPGGGFVLQTNGGEMECDRLLLATGGCRAPGAALPAVELGHSLNDPVPSLFTFHAGPHWLRELPGITLPDAEAFVPDTGLRQRGPLLITHQGLSGPVILRLSAWGARELAARDYRFTLRINWLPDSNQERIGSDLAALRADHPARLVSNCPLSPLPARLWEQLTLAAGIGPQTRWSNLPRNQTLAMIGLLTQTSVEIEGKSLNKDEFVTCGGVRLKEVDLRTMESRITPGLYFAGELLDIDGITGGFNFQSAWTTGWLAGKAMA